jgi:hypothetical protein
MGHPLLVLVEYKKNKKMGHPLLVLVERNPKVEL